MGITNERMKQLREQSDVTLKEMANLIGVSEATVQRYESGKITKVPYKAIIEYCKKFNVAPPYLMGWTDFPLKDPDVIKNNRADFLYELNDKEQILVEGYRNLSDVDRLTITNLIKSLTNK